MSTVTAPTTHRTSPLPSSPTGFLTDTWTVLLRDLTPKLRQPASMLFAMVQPLVFLGLFAPLLPTAEDGSALQWFVPGIVVMTALMGASMTGADLTAEIRSGSHERLLVSPLSRPSLLVGRALKEVVPVLLQTAVIIAVVTPFGFDLHLGGVLIGSVIVSLFAIGVGALSFALATAAKEQDWVFWTAQQLLIFPLLLLSGVLLPLDGAPGWLRFLSDINPMTYVVEAQRALYAGDLPADVVGGGLLAAAAVAVAGVLVGVRTMERSS